jgi:hypothetical protein
VARRLARVSRSVSRRCWPNGIYFGTSQVDDFISRNALVFRRSLIFGLAVLANAVKHFWYVKQREFGSLRRSR